MKNVFPSYLLYCTVLLSSGSYLYAETEVADAVNQTISTKDIISADADLSELKEIACEQVREIECILQSLKTALEKAPLANKELLRQEISLLYELVQNISGDRIQDFDEASLRDLLEINEVLINHLVEHTNGDFAQLCNIGQSFKKHTTQGQRAFVSMQNLRERYHELQDKIQIVLHRLENFDFESYVESINDGAEDALETMSAAEIAQTPAAIIAAQVTAFAAFCYFGKGLRQAIAYTALPLYLLRSKSYKDINKQYPWLNWLKKIVGSSEKAYSVSFCQGDDLGELNKWKAEQEKKHNILIKINKADQNDFNALKDFSIGVNDGFIYKFPMQMLFYNQLAEDFGDFIGWFDSYVLCKKPATQKSSLMVMDDKSSTELAKKFANELAHVLKA